MHPCIYTPVYPAPLNGQVQCGSGIKTMTMRIKRDTCYFSCDPIIL